MSTDRNAIDRFLDAPAFGVVGASPRRDKFGNKVLRCYLQQGRRAIPVNPREAEVEGIAAVAAVEDLPPEVASISIITPPRVTEAAVAAAIAKGIRNVWMQPGAESEAAIAACRAAGIDVIAGGPCLLVVLGFRDV
jgi:predicted CoA-binding protein